MSRIVTIAASAALALSAAAAGSAVAADADEAPNWSGFHVGGHIGGAGLSTSWTGSQSVTIPGPPGAEGQPPGPPTTVTTPIGASANRTAVDVGAQAGFDVQTGQFVFGVEGDFDYNSLNSQTVAASYTVRAHATDYGSIRARAGVAFDKVLVFATGGAAFSNLSFTTTTASGLVATASSGTGWTAGGGAEVRLSHNLSLVAEGSYASFGGHDLNAAGLNKTLADHVSANEGRGWIGLNFHF